MAEIIAFGASPDLDVMDRQALTAYLAEIRPPASPLPLRRTSTCSGGRSGKCGLVSIFCVIFFVMLLQRFLRYLKVADLVGRALAPALRVLGMRPAAATAMIVGVISGHRLRQRRHPQGSPQRRDVPARRVFLHDPDGARARHH